VLNDDDSQNDPEAHPYFVDRSAYCLRLLAGYADAMGLLRAGGLIDHETYPNGM